MDLGTKALIASIIVMVILIALLPVVKNSKMQKRWEEKNKIDFNEVRESWKQEELSREIVEVKLLGGGSTKYKRGGLGGAALGAFIGGAPGAVLGAILPSGKGVRKQRFAVKFGDGRVKIWEFAPGTSGYNTMMKYVKWEDVQ